MQGNEDDGAESSFSELASPGELSSDQNMGLAASGQEDHDDDRSPDMDAAPPLGVKLTVYRLLNMTILLSIGIIKGVLTYKGQSTTPTTLDWVGGALLATVLYWFGLYEERDPKKWEWFFQVDLAPAIGYFTKRFIGGVIGPYFHFDGIFTLYFSLGPRCWLVGGSLSVVHGGCILLLWYCLRVLTRRVRARAWPWQCATRFMDDYGPSAPLANRYGWFGAVGTVVGIFCGIVLVGLPYVVQVLYF